MTASNAVYEDDGLGHLDDSQVYGQLTVAARSVSKQLLRDPVTLARGLDPHYKMRPHLRVIGDAMAGIHRGEYDRLLIVTPPQVGKSTSVAEWGPFWWLCLHPMDRIAITSYSDDLALGRGKVVRQYIEEHGAEYDLEIRPGSGAAKNYEVTAGGGVRSVSVGSGLTGFPVNCVAGDVHIETPGGPMPIGAYVESGCGSQVLAYDHDQDRPVWASVTATSSSEREILEVVTHGGRIIRCTPEHRIHIPGRGYVAAASLRPGDRLTAAARLGGADVRAMQHDVPAATLHDRAGEARGEDRSVLRSGLLEQIQAGPHATMQGLRNASARPGEGEDVLYAGVQADRIPHATGLRRMREAVQHHDVRPRKAGQEGTHALHLLPEMRIAGPHPDPPVRGLWYRDAQPAMATHPLLLPGLQRGQPAAAREDARGDRLRVLRADLLPNQYPDGVLLAALLRHGSRTADDRAGQLAVQGWNLVRRLLPRDEAVHPGPGRPAVRGLQDAGDVHDVRPQWQDGAAHHVPRSPHQRGPERQPAGQPRQPLQDLPRRAPQVEHDAVAMVRPVRGGRVRVYDLQVEGASNFFAGQVLVHNCLIVDDPHKDRADAESEASRNAVHNWYSSTALKRLQADRNAVIAVMTRWHPDDFAGRRLEEEGRLENGGRWKVVHLPAVAHPSKFGPDPLGRADGDPLPHPKIPTKNKRKLSAWWADMKATSIVRDWHALAQGDPQPSEGALVSAELLRRIRGHDAGVTPQKIAVAVDPSGGGRDEAGVIGGYYGDDGRVWITHDRSGAMSSAEWSTVACMLAHETEASVVYVEANFGADMCTLAIRTSWETLQRAGMIPKKALMPMVQPVYAKQGKLLRAEPIAQQMVQDRVRLRGIFTDLEREWETWMPTDPKSPGRIDASVYLVYGLLPEADGSAVMHSPVAQGPTPRGDRPASIYGRSIGG